MATIIAASGTLKPIPNAILSEPLNPLPPVLVAASVVAGVEVDVATPPT